MISEANWLISPTFTETLEVNQNYKDHKYTYLQGAIEIKIAMPVDILSIIQFIIVIIYNLIRSKGSS